MRYCISLIALVVFMTPAFGQDFSARMKALEDAAAQTQQGLSNVKDEVASLRGEIVKLTAAVASLSGKGKADPFSSTNVAKTYTGTPCACGCVETGKCVCANCNVGCALKQVPATAAKNADFVAPFFLFAGSMESPRAVGSTAGYFSIAQAEAACYRLPMETTGPIMVHDAKGAMVDTVNIPWRTAAAPVQYYQQPTYYYPQQVDYGYTMGYTTSGASACGPGGCGMPAGRPGLFGRRGR